MATNYNFDPLGSMGSVYTHANAAVIPPQGMVITAIQFLADNILTELLAEQHPAGVAAGPKYVSTATAHGNGDAMQLCGNGNSLGPTVTMTGANAAVKVGQRVTAANPNYTFFPNHHNHATGIEPVFITAISANGLVLTLSRDVALVSNTNMIFSTPLGTGSGGATTSNAVFPKGLTIYGRWTSVKATADANGGIICYFGV